MTCSEIHTEVVPNLAVLNGMQQTLILHLGTYNNVADFM